MVQTVTKSKDSVVWNLNNNKNQNRMLVLEFQQTPVMFLAKVLQLGSSGRGVVLNLQKWNKRWGTSARTFASAGVRGGGRCCGAYGRGRCAALQEGANGVRCERVAAARQAAEQRILLSVLDAKLLQVRCGLGHLWIGNPPPGKLADVKFPRIADDERAPLMSFHTQTNTPWMAEKHRFTLSH